MLALESPPARVTSWHPLTRIAFRFCATYFALYVFPDGGARGPIRLAVSAVARQVFHVTRPLVISGSGSGDKTYDWVHAFTVLILSVLITAVWSVLDRRRQHYAVPFAWVRLVARLGLGVTMVTYGMAKVIPVQMPEPGLVQLLEPFGNLSPMGVLWNSIGASRPYEMFAGAVELAGGILLFMPRTATLGGLVCLASAIQIFVLNLSYDVPVKLFSFHLILTSLFLLAPDARRLLNVLLLNRHAEPSALPAIGRSTRARRLALVLQVGIGVCAVAANLVSARQLWHQYGGGAPKSPLYGVWNIERMSFDGQTRPPLLTDTERFRRVIFDRPAYCAFQLMNDDFVHLSAQIDMAARTLKLTGASGMSAGSFTFEQPLPNSLVLRGTMDGHTLHIEGRLFDRSDFLLVNRGFHWIQEYPFNR